MKCSGRVSKFGEMQVLCNSSQCFVSPKELVKLSVINPVPKNNPLSVMINSV